MVAADVEFDQIVDVPILLKYQVTLLSLRVVAKRYIARIARQLNLRALLGREIQNLI